MLQSNFRDIFNRRMARGGPINDEERQALHSLLAPPADTGSGAGSVDPGFTAGGESRAALEQGRETLRNQSPSFRDAFNRRRQQPSGEVSLDPTRVLSEGEFIRQQNENLKAGRPVWTTHATGYGTGSGRQQLPIPQQAAPVREDRVPQHIVDAVMQGQTRPRQTGGFREAFARQRTNGDVSGEPSVEGKAQADVNPTATLQPHQSAVNPLQANRQRILDTLGAQTNETGAPDNAPFGSSGEPFGSTRPRRTEPRDTIADDNQYLRDLERQPRNWKDKTVEVLDAISAGFGNKPRTTQTKREREISTVKNRLGRDLTVEGERSDIASKRASAYDRFTKPPAGSTRIVDEGEYRGVPSGTEIRQVWDPTRREMVDDVRNGRPVVSKSPPAERAAAKEIKYNFKGHAYLVPKDGGPATPIFQDDGTPLTKQANENGNVQTAYRLAPDGITQIQIERDSQTGEWVDSVAPGKRQVVRGRVGRIDTESGAPASALITDHRQRAQEQQESQRKRQSYDSEAQEWGGKEKAFRENKNTEDDAIKAKTAQLQALYQEQPGGTILNRGGRTQQAIETDRARLQKELETHRTNSARFQTEADNAAAAATTARRNAGMYSGGTQSRGAAQPQGPIGRPPAKDGKHHYTRAEIRAAADANGKSFDALYKTLKRNKNVVIDE